jgi:hypothetical protein
VLVRIGDMVCYDVAVDYYSLTGSYPAPNYSLLHPSHTANDAPTVDGSTADRLEIHNTQKKVIAAVQAALPLEIGDKITLLSLGSVIKELTEAPEFHNLVQVYPVGYKCKMFIPNLRT